MDNSILNSTSNSMPLDNSLSNSVSNSISDSIQSDNGINSTINEKKCSNTNQYSEECNKLLLESEEKNYKMLEQNPNKFPYLYPTLNDPNFNIKISQKKEFSDTKYDGSIRDIKEYADILSKSEFELSPHQAFVRNFMSFQTPYNSLLLYHGLGSGKTCSAIGVSEEMREYAKQMGLSKPIIIVASPNVQDNFKLQLFDERKLKLINGIWTIKGCIGNKLLKEINPTNMKGITKEKIISQIKSLINLSYSFMGYTQFSNEISRIAGDKNDPMSIKNRNIQQEFNNRLIVIDEVHTIRISDDNKNKDIASNLMYLVSTAQNVRLLLLSATPMFNNYKEIIWILNLMNMNDRRGVVTGKQIFDKDGNFKKAETENGEESGKELFMRKVTGYISYVRGENPYTFPFRIYPNIFSPKNTFHSTEEYPKYQLNCKKIPNDKKIQKVSLYLNSIGQYQQLGYTYIIDRLRHNKSRNFKEIQNFGYNDLQLPLESLNIVYPLDGLDRMVKDIKPCEISSDEDNSPSIEMNEGPSEINTEEIFSDGPSEINTDEIFNDGSISSNKSLEESNNEHEVELGVEEKEGEGQGEGEEEEEEEEGSNISVPNIKIKSNITSLNEEESDDSCVKIQKQIDELNVKLIQCKNTKSRENLKGGGEGSDSSSSDTVYLNAKQITGVNGLERVMKYIDSKSPAEKGSFEYKEVIKQKFGKIFSPNEIGKYSSKIKSICENIYNSETDTVSNGIILIYSSYIDAGIIPMTLALEEMGFTKYGQNGKSLFKELPTESVDVRTMKPPSNKKDFIPARYVMITGDTRLSPNNDMDVKALTNDDNVNGHKIKVVLISEAGSEGLDFKAIRQIHIMDPWYNMNRSEQIIGRGVRNFSHKDLPFEQRNVEIFLHGTILISSPQEEAVDLYIYRVAELKAIQIGKITRLLKQTAVDCIINHEQSEFTKENFKQIENNARVTQILSTGLEINNFEVGDVPNSANCDYMDTCEYDCLPDIKIDESETELKLNTDSYNQTFMLVNSDKIIQKIKELMKVRFFYKKKDLFYFLNIPKKYPTTQIYAALTYIINDHTEYIIDKYGRTGYLINIGDYYLFQPSELNYDNISIYDRSVPLDFKHNMINFEIKTDLSKNIPDRRTSEIEMIDNERGKKVFEEMKTNYNTAKTTGKIERGEDNWYKYCSVVIRKLIQEQMSVDVLQDFVISHLIESLMYTEKIELLHYLNLSNEKCKKIEGDIFLVKIKKYFCEKIIYTPNLTAIVLFDGPSRTANLKINILHKNNNWKPAEPEDIRDLGAIINEKYKLKKIFNEFVGFIGFEEKQKYMVFKVKDTTKQRHTGSRCDQAGKKKTIDLLNKILGREEFTKENTKGMVQQELCIRQEFLLRNLEREQKDGKTWFLTPELAVISDF